MSPQSHYSVITYLQIYERPAQNAKSSPKWSLSKLNWPGQVWYNNYHVMFDCRSIGHIPYNNEHIHISSFSSASSYLFCYKFHETLMWFQSEGNGPVLTWTTSSYPLRGLLVTRGHNENIKRRPQVCPCATLQHILVVYEKSQDFNERILWSKLWPPMGL